MSRATVCACVDPAVVDSTRGDVRAHGSRMRRRHDVAAASPLAVLQQRRERRRREGTAMLREGAREQRRLAGTGR